MKNGLSARLVKLRLVEDCRAARLDPRAKIWLGTVRLVDGDAAAGAAGWFSSCFTCCSWAGRACCRSQPGRSGGSNGSCSCLFVLDALLINLELAVTVTLRIAMLAGVFTLLFATTTPAEFTLALEKLRLPYRYAFSLGLAFQSLTLLEEEWNSILEAQRRRGALRPFGELARQPAPGLRPGGIDRPGGGADDETRLVDHRGGLCARFRLSPAHVLPHSCSLPGQTFWRWRSRC